MKEIISENKNNIFMSVAVAVVFVMQGYSQLEQNRITTHISNVEDETLTEQEIEAKINKEVHQEIKHIEGEILKIERETKDMQNKYYQHVIDLLTKQNALLMPNVGPRDVTIRQKP